MNNIKSSIHIVCGFLVLLTAVTAEAQFTNYFQAVTNLNPVGYWPMHEVEAAAPGDIETNYGTLGLLGTGYYPDWAADSGAFIRGYTPGALPGDSDPAVYFNAQSGGQAGGLYFTNALYLPRTSPLTTLNPPFTVECWFYAANTVALGDIWCSTSDEGLNQGGNYAGAAGSVDGIRINFEGNGQLVVYSYYKAKSVHAPITTAANTIALNQWYYLVLTCDAQTNLTLYVDDTNAGSASAVGLYAPDTWTPFRVGEGCAGGGWRQLNGSVDEVAIYTNVIPDITQHYADGTNAVPTTSYYQDVLNDNPVIYLRMDSPAYNPPDVSAWPVLTNYGSVAADGVYTPGTMPGIVPGQFSNPTRLPFTGVSGNVTPLSGVSSFADAGYAPAYNPVGAVPFTVTAMFRGNPSDNRYQTIVGHSDNSWRIAMNTNGKLQCQLGTNSTSVINSAGVYNDGNWHQIVDVYTPVSDPNVTGTNALYVDGVLDTSVGTVSTNGIGPGSLMDVMIGADPQYTNNPDGLGRQFAGQVCEVAIFTNALTADQVQTLYSACQIQPYITAQPVTGRSINGGPGTYIYFGVITIGSSPLAYQWYFNTSSSYSGATPLVDDATHYVNSTTSQVTVTNLTGDDSGYYFVVITNNYGSATSTLASLTVNVSPVIVDQLPATYTNLYSLYAGANPTFSVAVAGTPPLSYQWYTNDVLDGAASTNSLTMTNVQMGFITNYCIVTNLQGSATSTVWTASVIADPTAPYPQSVLALNPIGYWRLNEPDDNDGNFGGDGNPNAICFDYAGGNDGLYTNVNLSQPGYSPIADPSDTSALFGENGPPADSYAGQVQGVDFSSPTGTSKAFTIEAWTDGYSQSYDAGIMSKGYGGAEQFDLDTGADGGNPTHAFRFLFRDASGNAYSVNSTIAPSIYSSVWYHLVGVVDEANGYMSLYINGALVGTTAISPGIGVLSSAYPMSIGSRMQNVSSDFNYQYYGYVNDVAVFNYALSPSQVANEYASAGNTPPFFAQPPPTNETVIVHTALTIPVTAYGTPTLNYTWYDPNNNVLASGSTNGTSLDATFTTNNVPAAWDGHTLELTVNNGYGQTNVYVTLSVLTAPVITNDLPAQITVVQGQSYTYSIGAVGAAPLSYRWFAGASPISNQTNTTYTLTGGSTGTFTYSAVVTNFLGSITSVVSTLTIVPPPTNSYSAGILGLNPVGYWPMHEVEAGAPGDIETNYGTLGLLGTGYYPDWAVNSGAFTHGYTPGALAGDSDPAVYFDAQSSGQAGGLYFTNALYVPRTSPLTTLNPPFTVECWFYAANTVALGDVWCSTSDEGLNQGGNYAGAAGSVDGIRINFEGNGQLVVYSYYKAKSVNTILTTAANTIALNQWSHLVLTCDAQTNVTLYVNDTVAGSASAFKKYSPDTWTPFRVGEGCAGGGWRQLNGSVDEVAIYTNVIPDITQHYADGTNAAPTTSYYQDVLNDNPVIYLRMDSPAYNPPDVSTWPVLTNYGSAAIDGVYTPGTMPGIVPGPVQTNGAPYSGLSGTNVAQFSGVSSFADAGYAPAYDPVGAVPFTVTAMFRGNPSDNRYQTIVGHSDNSWRIAMNTNGKLQCALGTDSGSVVNSARVYNDGNWHQVVDVYTPASDPNVTGTNALYVDGVLDTSVGTVSTNGIGPGSPLDVMIGSDPQYTNNPAGLGRQFAGQVCEVALFTNAITASQIQQLYNATVPVAVNTNLTNIVFSMTGGTNLVLSWPADHKGWTLQAQTNKLSVGISTNWVDVSGSTITNQVVIPINLTNGSVFYRLMYQP